MKKMKKTARFTRDGTFNLSRMEPNMKESPMVSKTKHMLYVNQNSNTVHVGHEWLDTQAKWSKNYNKKL